MNSTSLCSWNLNGSIIYLFFKLVEKMLVLKKRHFQRTFGNFTILWWVCRFESVIPDDGAVMLSLLRLVLASTASRTKVWGSPPSCPATHLTSKASVVLTAPRKVQLRRGDGLPTISIKSISINHQYFRNVIRIK